MNNYKSVLSVELLLYVISSFFFFFFFFSCLYQIILMRYDVHCRLHPARSARDVNTQLPAPLFISILDNKFITFFLFKLTKLCNHEMKFNVLLIFPISRKSFSHSIK